MTPTRFMTIIVAAMFLSVSYARGQVPIHIQVDDPRPMKAAIDSLQKALGLPVNYEDPPFEYSGDIRDVSDQVRNAAQKAANPNVRIMVPRGGQLVLDGTLLNPQPGVGDLLPILTQLRTQYEAASYPGRFGITQISGVATVEPVAVLSPDGAWKNVTAAMQTHISFASGQRKASETLILLAKTMSQRLSVKVGIGRIPFAAFENTQFTMGANDEAAGVTLVRIFNQLSQSNSAVLPGPISYSYSLLYDPGLKYYMLHVNAISRFKVSPGNPPAPTPGSMPPSGSAGGPYTKTSHK